MAENRYVIVSPVRDEEEYLPETLKCIINQSVRPLEYIFVNDGSTDRTEEIINEVSRSHPWIRCVNRSDRGERKVGSGVIEAFYDGYESISIRDYDFICKMDGDLTVGPLYFETLFNKFEKDPLLGSASGKLFLKLPDDKLVEERITDESVLGGVLCMRRRCFEDTGGFVCEVMWDGISFHRARMAGWRTRSYNDPELMIYDHRLMGSSERSIYHGRIRWGWGQYFMGTHPLYILVVGLYRMKERPFIIGGILIVLGFLKGFLTRTPRYNYIGFRKSLRSWQLERLKIGKRLEDIPLPPDDMEYYNLETHDLNQPESSLG